MKNDDTGWKCAGALLAAIVVPVIMVYAYFANGYVLSRLWEWFIVTKFGLPTLNIPEAIGIATVVSFLTTRYTNVKGNEKSSWEKWGDFLTVLVAPWITLLVGWIVYSTWIMPK